MNTHYIFSRKNLTTFLVIIICIFLLAGCGSKTDAMEYISVSFTGYNGNGTVNLGVDYDSMIQSIIGEEPDGDDYEKLSRWMNKYLVYDEGIEVSYFPKEGLSNGDTITIKITLSETAAKKVIGGENKFIVSGLPEIESVDIFKDISLRYDGIVGDGTMVYLDKLTNDQILQDCNFSIDPQVNIKNGDTITVSITNVDTLAEKHLCAPAEISKTFTVSGLDEYLTDSSLLPMNTIQDIIDQYVPSCQKADNSIFTYGVPAYYKTYFCVGKDDVIGADFNQLLVYACYDEYVDGQYRWTVYTPLVFRNLILKADGSIDIEYSDGANTVFQTSPEAVDAYMDDLNITNEIYP